MKTNIFDRTNTLIGFTIEDNNQIRIYNRTGSMLGFYIKQSDATHTISHGYYGKGNQLLRLLK